LKPADEHAVLEKLTLQFRVVNSRRTPAFVERDVLNVFQAGDHPEKSEKMPNKPYLAARRFLLALAFLGLVCPVFGAGTQDGTIWAFKAKWDSKKKPAFEGMDGTEHLKSKIDWRVFETGASFEVGDVGIETFSIPHDAQDPVGFILRTSAGTIGFATDLGHVTKLVLERIRRAHVLVLESNHDVKMLQDCPRRSWALKQRILGRHGHISNVTAAETIAQIISADLRQLYLAHLSRECNKPELAEHIMAEQLHHLGAKHVQLVVAGQDVPCATIEL